MALKRKIYRIPRKIQSSALEKLKIQISDNFVGHGWIDFVMIFRLIKFLNKGLPLDIKMYNSVLWSTITPLSELSVAQLKCLILMVELGKTRTKQKY